MIQSVLHLIGGFKRILPRPWLLVGKGPTLNNREQVDFDKFNVFTLNHACTVVRSNIAHFTDYSAWLDCNSYLYENQHNVCLPWYPHLNNRSGHLDLNHYADNAALLRWHRDEHKLFSYNSTLSRLLKNPDLPIIRVKYFSAVAGFNILAAAGIKRIFTLGIDGGTRYGKDFDPKDLLANGRADFDVQFEEIAKTCRDRGVEFKPLF